MLRHRRIIRRTVVNRIDRADDPIFGISGARNTTTSAGPDLRKGNIQMMSVRRAAERGQTTTGWLDSRHSFSFGRYRNPDHTGFRALRVINENRVDRQSTRLNSSLYCAPRMPSSALKKTK